MMESFNRYTQREEPKDVTFDCSPPSCLQVLVSHLKVLLMLGSCVLQVTVRLQDSVLLETESTDSLTGVTGSGKNIYVKGSGN